MVIGSFTTGKRNVQLRLGGVVELDLGQRSHMEIEEADPKRLATQMARAGSRD